MKKISILIIGLVALSALTGVADEYGYLFVKGADVFPSITLGAGDRIVILASKESVSASSLPTAATILITLSNGEVISLEGRRLGTHFYEGNSVNRHSPGMEEDRTIAGPCTISLSKANDHLPDSYAYASYRIVRASDNSISPSNVISLPADVNGDMQLVFESSDDLLTWTQEFSFTHNSTNSAGKFFRTRLIQGAGQ